MLKSSYRRSDRFSCDRVADFETVILQRVKLRFPRVRLAATHGFKDFLRYHLAPAPDTLAFWTRTTPIYDLRPTK